MAAALEAGVTRLFRIGGAHAIAALAYGTDDRSARRQDRRPRQPLRRGRQSAGRRPTAPSTSTPDRRKSSSSPARDAPAWIAADLIAQAEHDPGCARDLHHLEPSARRPRRRSGGGDAAPDATIVQRSLEANGAVIIARERGRGDGAGESHSRPSIWCSIAKRWRGARSPPAPCSSVRTPRKRPATTPPDRTTCCRRQARRASAAACRAADFVRVMSVQRLTRAGLARLAPTIVPLARAEGLEAHAESIEIRLRNLT